MGRMAVTVGAAYIAAVSVVAQQQPQVFEVASVRRNSSLEVRGSGGPQPGGRYSVTNAPLRSLILSAYDTFQFGRIFGMPDWADERYDINAKAAGDVEDFGPLLRALLRDRFGFRAHTETRPVPSYVLTVLRTDGRLGPRMRSSTVDCNDAQAVKKAREARQPGQLPPCGGGVTSQRIAVCAMSVNSLANILGSLLQRPVVNRTGLTTRFDVELDYLPPGTVADSQADNRVSIFTALQEQLGLRLQPEDLPFEVLIIDSVDRPTPD